MYPKSAVKVNDWLAPAATVIAPAGDIFPPAPALAVIVYVVGAKLAVIVWAALTPVNVYELAAPTETPSTITAVIW